MDFLGIISRLIQAQLDFVVVGGIAATIHGCSLVTQDVDICCDFHPDNLLRLQKALQELHPVHRMTPQKIPLNLIPENCRNLKNIYLDTDLGVLDCLSHIDGVGDYEQVIMFAQKMEVDDFVFNVLSIEALIQAKQSLNRDRDRQAIIQLQSILRINKNNSTNK